MAARRRVAGARPTNTGGTGEATCSSPPSLPEALTMIPRLVVLLAIAAALVAGLHQRFSTPRAGETFRIIDGDTLQIDGKIIQLYGIDAPELGQLCETDGKLWHCGVAAALALRKLIDLSRSSLHCSPWHGDGTGTTGPDTSAQVCEVRNEDVALVMLHGGYGLASPESFPDYVEAQEQASRARLGIWHSDFVPPWEWREGVASQARPSDSVRECNVKGVIGDDGRRIYYVPTDPEYAAITLAPSVGDVMFCSDEEARLAGWHRVDETAGTE